jgi:hypothetical protein
MNATGERLLTIAIDLAAGAEDRLVDAVRAPHNRISAHRHERAGNTIQVGRHTAK